MLTVIVVTFHIIVALTLILVVLLQVGKGQSIGAAFGGAGSSQTLFGSRGPATFLSHMTTIAAAIFMLTSLTLAYFSSHARQRSTIIDQVPATQAPAPQMPASETPVPMTPDTPATEQTPTTDAPAAEQTPSPMQPAEGQPSGSGESN